MKLVRSPSAVALEDHAAAALEQLFNMAVLGQFASPLDLIVKDMAEALVLLASANGHDGYAESLKECFDLTEHGIEAHHLRCMEALDRGRRALSAIQEAEGTAPRPSSAGIQFWPALEVEIACRARGQQHHQLRFFWPQLQPPDNSGDEWKLIARCRHCEEEIQWLLPLNKAATHTPAV